MAVPSTKVFDTTESIVVSVDMMVDFNLIDALARPVDGVVRDIDFSVDMDTNVCATAMAVSMYTALLASSEELLLSCCTAFCC